MSKQVIIIGAGGHAKVIADIIGKSGDVVLGFLDDYAETAPYGDSLLGGFSDMPRWVEEANFIVAIGNSSIRKSIMDQNSCHWYTAIHPDAIIASHVVIGEGSVIMAGAVVNSGTMIGQGCIINTGATVDHDNQVGEFTHISVGAHLAGAVSVGVRTWIGIGAVVSNNISICDDCMIGAGAVVVRDIVEPGTYVGVPVKKVQK